MQIRPPWAFCFPLFPFHSPLSLSLSPVRPASHSLTLLESVHELPGHTKILPLPTDTDDISATRSFTLPAFFQSRSTKKAFCSFYLSNLYLYLRYVRNDFNTRWVLHFNFMHDEPLTTWYSLSLRIFLYFGKRESLFFSCGHLFFWHLNFRSQSSELSFPSIPTVYKSRNFIEVKNLQFVICTMKLTSCIVNTLIAECNSE